MDRQEKEFFEDRLVTGDPGTGTRTATAIILVVLMLGLVYAARHYAPPATGTNVTKAQACNK